MLKERCRRWPSPSSCTTRTRGCRAWMRSSYASMTHPWSRLVMFTPLELVGRVHASNCADPIRILLPDSDLENGRFGSDPYEIINSTGTVFCLLVHCTECTVPVQNSLPIFLKHSGCKILDIPRQIQIGAVDFHRKGILRHLQFLSLSYFFKIHLLTF